MNKVGLTFVCVWGGQAMGNERGRQKTKRDITQVSAMEK